MPYFPNSPRPTDYPPSPFAAAVGSFLASYGDVKGIQNAQQDAADRKRAADDADLNAQMNEKSRGFSRLTTPTIEAPPNPDQSWESKVGSFLSDRVHGGTPQPSTILMKTGPSERETEIANEQTYQTGRDVMAQKSASDIAELHGAMQSANTDKVIAAENARAAAAQSGENYRAGLSRATTKAALGQTAKHSVVDDAIDATGGYAQRAWNSIPDATKQQYGITKTDMNAGTQRFTDRKAALTREGIDATNERAAARGGNNPQMLPRDLNGKPIPAPAATGGKPGNIVLPANPSPRTSNATPNVMAPFASFAPQQQKTIAEAGRRVRSGQGTLDEAKRALPADVFSAVASLRALSSEEKSQAQKDPHFRAFLHTLGYDDSEL